MVYFLAVNLDGEATIRRKNVKTERYLRNSTYIKKYCIEDSFFLFGIDFFSFRYLSHKGH